MLVQTKINKNNHINMKQKENEKSYTMRLYSTNYYRQMNNLTIFVKESEKVHFFLKLLVKTQNVACKASFPAKRVYRRKKAQVQDLM